jgi:hypothetical protein
MENFAKDNPMHVFIPADDPGYDQKPLRVPRCGWSAFIPGVENEQSKMWTITLENFVNSKDNSSFTLKIQKILSTRRPL